MLPLEFSCLVCYTVNKLPHEVPLCTATCSERGYFDFIQFLQIGSAYVFVFYMNLIVYVSVAFWNKA